MPNKSGASSDGHAKLSSGSSNNSTATSSKGSSNNSNNDNNSSLVYQYPKNVMDETRQSGGKVSSQKKSVAATNIIQRVYRGHRARSRLHSALQHVRYDDAEIDDMVAVDDFMEGKKVKEKTFQFTCAASFQIIC